MSDSRGPSVIEVALWAAASLLLAYMLLSVTGHVANKIDDLGARVDALEKRAK